MAGPLQPQRSTDRSLLPPLQEIKPRNARSKRAVEAKAPKPVENPKKALFLKGTSSSEVLNAASADLAKLRHPHSAKLQKKNEIHPFADPASLEFLSQKNDASLLLFASHSKKRPHTLTLGRTFDHKILDLLELHLDATSFRPLESFAGAKVPLGLKPLLAFSGSVFDDDAALLRPRHALLKSFLLDYFTQTVQSRVEVAGLRYIVSVTAEEPSEEIEQEARNTAAAPCPPVHLRVYLLRTLKPTPGSGSKTPRVEVNEMGPRIDFRLGRRQAPDPNLWKEAMRRPRDPNVERRKKNVETDLIGDKIGRIHLGRQDLSMLQSRKMKGLKRDRQDLEAEIGPAAEAEDEDGMSVVSDKVLLPRRESKRFRKDG